MDSNKDENGYNIYNSRLGVQCNASKKCDLRCTSMCESCKHNCSDYKCRNSYVAGDTCMVTMDRKRAEDILIAHACCVFDDMCDKCPWKCTDDCKNTRFQDVLKEAIDVLLGENK